MLPTDRSSITSFNARRLILVIFLQRGDNLLAYKDKKTFFYTIHLMDGNCVNIAEEYIHPLYSYIVVDSETGNIICVFDREQKPFAS